jgi:hypothetical protein
MPDDKKQQPDLDLIAMVQQARMVHDDQATPSQIAGVYWIEAKCQVEDCPPPTSRAGQWMLETTVQQVDSVWQTIKQATEQGRLGYKAKVSTASRSGQSSEARTVCVCAYDSADEADVQRIRRALESLPIAGDWHYSAVRDG